MAKVLAGRLKEAARSLRSAQRQGWTPGVESLRSQVSRLRAGLRYVRDYASYIRRAEGGRLGFAFEPQHFATPKWGRKRTEDLPRNRNLDPAARPQED